MISGVKSLKNFLNELISSLRLAAFYACILVTINKLLVMGEKMGLCLYIYDILLCSVQNMYKYLSNARLCHRPLFRVKSYILSVWFFPRPLFRSNSSSTRVAVHHHASICVQVFYMCFFLFAYKLLYTHVLNVFFCMSVYI